MSPFISGCMREGRKEGGRGGNSGMGREGEGVIPSQLCF